MRSRFVLAVPLLSAMTGCAGTVMGDGTDAEAASSTAAVVVVERTSSGSEAPRSEAVARFMRVRADSRIDGQGIANDVLRVVGASADIPAIGTCASVSSLGAAKQSSSSVQLLDVGTVTMEADGVQTHLAARRVPDVVDLVSGVVYARANAGELPARTRYDVRVSGPAESEITSFAISAIAPRDLGELRVAGQDAAAGGVALGAGAIDLTWEPVDGAEADIVYVDVRGHGATIRCAFADAGHALIPATAMAATEGTAEGTLSVHRVHRETFRAGGIDSGEVRFDFARVIAFSRR